MEIDFFNLVANLGFPIVAFFLMYRMANTTIKENTKVIAELVEGLKNRKW